VKKWTTMAIVLQISVTLFLPRFLMYRI
jgi:hypothetical protein